MLPIDEIVCSDETLSSLCSLIDGTDLVDSLSNEIFTLFAPNNDALDGVDLSDEETVSQHLRYQCGQELTMGDDGTTKTSCNDGDTGHSIGRCHTYHIPPDELARKVK